MPRRSALSLALLTLLTTLATAPATAHPRHPYSMEVLVDGRPLDALHGRGRTYVEAREGREYAIRLANHTGARVAVALSVDGLNSIDAKTTAAREASKWILGPWETVTIGGWQTGSTTARRFFFTTEDHSYGAWLGKTTNLGVIAAAFFRERRPEPPPYVRQRSDRDSERREKSAPRAPSAEPQSSAAGAPSEEHAATGMGDEIEHRVERVAFDAESNPAAVVELRYEFRDALVALGLLPRNSDPLARRERARGFDDLGYAPVQPR